MKPLHLAAFVLMLLVAAGCGRRQASEETETAAERRVRESIVGEIETPPDDPFGDGPVDIFAPSREE